jgi:hypothetical protein
MGPAKMGNFPALTYKNKQTRMEQLSFNKLATGLYFFRKF